MSFVSLNRTHVVAVVGALALAACGSTASTCDFSGGPGVCVARLPGGSACAGDSQCTTNSCTTDGHCAVNSFVDVFGFCGRNVF